MNNAKIYAYKIRAFLIKKKIFLNLFDYLDNNIESKIFFLICILDGLEQAQKQLHKKC